MKHFASFIIGLASVLPMLVLQYEAKTGLGQHWEQNRALLEERMRINHTAGGSFYEDGFDANVNALDQYMESLDAAKALAN